MEKKLKCFECKGTYVKKIQPYEYRGQIIGKYPILICDTCGDAVYESTTCDQMEKELKKRKLWGLRAKEEKALIEQVHRA